MPAAVEGGGDVIPEACAQIDVDRDQQGPDPDAEDMTSRLSQLKWTPLYRFNQQDLTEFMSIMSEIA